MSQVWRQAAPREEVKAMPRTETPTVAALQAEIKRLQEEIAWDRHFFEELVKLLRPGQAEEILEALAADLRTRDAEARPLHQGRILVVVVKR